MHADSEGPGNLRPTFAELSPDDAKALMRRNHVGRLAFTFHDRVDIEPISYVFQDGWVYARTSPGTKLTTVRHDPWVAIEADEARGPFDWQSVVVHGTLYFLENGGTAGERKAFADAVELLRTLEARAFTVDDPTPHRTVLFRIHADTIVGRSATSAR
jgi:hypothetical protein